MPEFKFAYCIPHNASGEAGARAFEGFIISDDAKLFMVDGEYRFIIEEKLLVDKDDTDKYAFDIVLSTSERLPSAPAVNSSSVNPEEIKSSHGDSKSFKELFPDKYQGMLKLLSDTDSVNTAFVFTIHSCERKVALWAHRTLLDKSPRFQEQFKACHQQTDAADNRLMLIPIEGITLTTFCVLLKYIYSDDLDLDVDPSLYLICDMDQPKDKPSVDSISRLAVLNKSLKGHNAAQFYATWNVKDKVTWSDLFLAADRFEIAGLRKQCLENLFASVDESNAMEILFGVGTRFQEIHDYVMEYISQHLQDVFSIQTKDPFKRFSNHESYHEVMLELLRLQSRK